MSLINLPTGHPKNFKTLFVGNTAEGTSFTQRISVDFPVDQIILRTVRWANNDYVENADRFFLLSSDLVNGPLTICDQPVIDNDPTNSGVVGARFKADSRFKGPGHPINSEFRFWFTDIEGDQLAGFDTFSLQVSLEFLFIQH